MEDTKTVDLQSRDVYITYISKVYMHNAHLLVIFHAIRNLQFSQSIVSKK